MTTIDIFILSRIKGIGPASIKFLVEEYPDFSVSSPADIFDLLADAKNKNKRIKLPLQEEVENSYDDANLLSENSLNQNIRLVSILDEEYPQKFTSILNAPPIIFVKGNTSALNQSSNVAIIGTRQPTDYGARVGERLASILTEHGFTIISGLAKGCDTAAHLGCVKNQGVSVAILANPLDTIYPKENTELAENIIDLGGCLISEYPIGTKTLPQFFVQRDRLQSGLSDAVIVVETDVKGGTMHTVEFAQKQKRGIYCLFSHPENLKKHAKFQGNLMLVSQNKATPLSTNLDIDNFINKYKLKKVFKEDDVYFNEKGQGEIFK